MKTIHLMLIKFFIPIFLITLLFFVLVFQLLDIFSNLWTYISREISMVDIGRLALLYMPKCLSYSLPIALLFSISFVLGSLYMNNELISVFGSGISLYDFIAPLIVLGVLLSIWSLLFEETTVIDTFREKNELFKVLTKKSESYSNSNVTVISGNNRFIYQVNYYNDQKRSLSGVTIIERDARNRFVQRIDAEYGEWNGKNWVLHGCRIFSSTDTLMEETEKDVYDDEELTERPSIFRRISHDIDEMVLSDAQLYISQLKRAGLSYQEALSKFYRKFAFALTPLIVVLISSSIGGLFEKNVLLMSLLSSLGIVVVYYVVQMVAMTLSRNGYIPPAMGAWSSFVLFFSLGIVMLKISKT